MKRNIVIGCFISPHGLGHASRVCAILSALQAQVNDLVLHLFTSLPETIFQESLKNYHFHHTDVDVGLVQQDSLQVDLDKTVVQLSNHLSYPESFVEELADQCRNFSLLLCDIAPLGIIVAKRAGIPSVLVENFTWDWIYEPYEKKDGRMEEFRRYFDALFHRADYRIQTEPICRPVEADLRCGPIFRSIRSGRDEMRQRLDCHGRQMILITMGGIAQELPFIDQLKQLPYFFILPGQHQTKMVGDNVLLLQQQGEEYYHPDLINSADLVLCKSGYSTVAECYQAGARVCCVSREIFPESDVIEEFVLKEMNGSIISQGDFLSGSWLLDLPELLGKKPVSRNVTNGAVAVADFLLPILSHNTGTSGTSCI